MRRALATVVLATVLIQSAALGSGIHKEYRYGDWTISYVLPREFKGDKDATVAHSEFKGFDEMGEGNGAIIYRTMWVAHRVFAEWAPGTGWISLVPVPEEIREGPDQASLSRHFVRRSESATVEAEAKILQMSSGTWIRIDRRSRAGKRDLEGVLFVRIVGEDAVMIIAAGALDPDKKWPERLANEIAPAMEQIAASIRVERRGSEKTGTTNQPNHALQTTPVTRSICEKTIEFGHPKRGV